MNTAPTLGFIDTETTGLHPYLHEIWEVALITEDDDMQEQEHRWFLPVDLAKADPVALEIGGYHARHPNGYDYVRPQHHEPGRPDTVTDEWTFAEGFARLTRGMHLVCAMPSFDIPRLDDLLRKNHALPEWHYHVTCVESMIRGKYAVEFPWRSKDLLQACGIGMPEEDKHTALGDARWVRDAYRHCMDK